MIREPLILASGGKYGTLVDILTYVFSGLLIRTVKNFVYINFDKNRRNITG